MIKTRVFLFSVVLLRGCIKVLELRSNFLIYIAAVIDVAMKTAANVANSCCCCFTSILELC